jgi:hypothetical protein
MNREAEHERLRRLERKVDNLTWVLGAQTILLALFALAYLLQLSRYLLLLLLVGIPTLFVLRRAAPQWRRRVGMLWGLWDRRRVKISEPPS